MGHRAIFTRSCSGIANRKSLNQKSLKNTDYALKSFSSFKTTLERMKTLFTSYRYVKVQVTLPDALCR